MGMLELNQLMSMKRRNRRRQIQTRNGSIASCAKRKGSLCQHDEHSLDGQLKGYILGIKSP
ncbi:hypothetical protein BDA96_03G469700 [Sorghum bicolor]|uniref:Uncharacterized protein n=1 Tax=Sorghum bicolor TaxID=4558 RepID=A0A921RJT9_SORBI|nr:hypothetical protein BDA96_03G469700 [Sorghum bicolor]